MMDSKKAQEELKKFHVEAWAENLNESARELPDELRSSARALVGMTREGRRLTDEVTEDEIKKQNDAVNAILAFDAKQRMALFKTLFPKIPETVEAAWQLMERLPYQRGYNRKPFRAASDPETLNAARIQWLRELIQELEGYNPDIEWLATWGTYLHWGYGVQQGSLLLAAALDAKGAASDSLFETMCECANGNHAIGGMGRHIVKAFLSSSRQDCWEYMTKMLLAAQRQEGLRQSILESIDESHPEAFRKMITTILEEDLTRFSATVRAVNVWFGFQWDSVSSTFIDTILERAIKFSNDATARDKAIASGEAEDAYLALWTMAFKDAPAAIGPAAGILKDRIAERRFAGLHLLAQTGLESARKNCAVLIDDEDLRISHYASTVALPREGYGPHATVKAAANDLFERYEKLVARYPDKEAELPPIVWPWMKFKVSKEGVANKLPRLLGERPATRLLPYVKLMGSYERASVINDLTAMPGWQSKPEVRDTIFSLVADATQYTRSSALEALKKCSINSAEAERLEALLSRRAEDLRRGILVLLASQSDFDALASADRLLASKSEPIRQGGLELLRVLKEANRSVDGCRLRAKNYQASRPKRTETEETQLRALLDENASAVSMDNALGLMDLSTRTKALPVKKCIDTFITDAALRCVQSLDELIHQNRETNVCIRFYNWRAASEDQEDEQELRSEERLLGNVGHAFPHPNPRVALEKDLKRLPLREIWETWWNNRSADKRDADGLELVRALAALKTANYSDLKDWRKDYIDSIYNGRHVGDLNYQPAVTAIFSWLMRLSPLPAHACDWLLDASETSLALLPEKHLVHVDGEDSVRYRYYSPDKRDEAARLFSDEWRGYYSPVDEWLDIATSTRHFLSAHWKDAHTKRLWQQHKWLDEPVLSDGRAPAELAEEKHRNRSVPRHLCDLNMILEAMACGNANEADLLDRLPQDLRELTRRKRDKRFDTFPVLSKWVPRYVERVIDVELERGEAPTAASSAALAIRSLIGADHLIRIVRALGKGNLTRGGGWRSGLSRSEVFSHLIRICVPAENDTPESFAKKAKESRISSERWVEVAVYAPHWARFIEHALGRKGLAEGVWWIHAHTKDSSWSVEQEIKEIWTAEVAERTPLKSQDLIDGAVDVAWFHRSQEMLGEKNWLELYEAAKFAAGGTGHTRAKLFADAMQGRSVRKELVQRINLKRHQDSVRALGLLPLESGKKREADLLERYDIIQEFIRSSRQFGSQRQVSEKRAAAIAMQNLARTAGFADPIRLEWAMEARSVEDLKDGRISEKVGDVTVALNIDAFGEVTVIVEKAGKELKTIPDAVKKNAKVKELRDRKVTLKKQISRIRRSLEELMCRGEAFTADELKGFMKHPLLAPILRSLVLIGEGIQGYPVNDGKALENHQGKKELIKKNETLRIAHAHDLYKTKQWHLWQRDCLARERIQPFKQIFRELYRLTDEERKEKTLSRRYAGQQIQPRQALALLGNRGWVSRPEEGVRKTFHDIGLIAEIGFLEGFFTPAEIEGLTVESISFIHRENGKAAQLDKISPVAFSEIMRDMDLVVSVAHRGGVDPEASASTVEMRTSLLKETFSVLKIGNVKLKGSHAFIKGDLGEYNVHLGSGVTHIMPGGALCIIPVNAQHRGRIFLPFADSDPRTAEVLTKILLLARDKEIKDPSILAQIRSA